MLEIKYHDKVYYNSFTGMIKAKYIGKSIDNKNVAILITATKSPVYKWHEIIVASPTRVVPREGFKKTGRFTFTVPEYCFQNLPVRLTNFDLNVLEPFTRKEQE